MGGICCAGEPFQIGKPWAKEEPWAHFSYKRDSWLAVAAVNALPQLMALIAEVERLRTAEGDAMTYKAGMENVAQQRGQLKADNAGLKTGYEAYEQVNAGLKAEVEALLDGMTQIMRATRLGDPAFAIACEVVGELCGAAMGQGEQS